MNDKTKICTFFGGLYLFNEDRIEVLIENQIEELIQDCIIDFILKTETTFDYLVLKILLKLMQKNHDINLTLLFGRNTIVYGLPYIGKYKTFTNVFMKSKNIRCEFVDQKGKNEILKRSDIIIGLLKTAKKHLENIDLANKKFINLYEKI